MNNGDAFKAYIRTLERELRDAVLQEQSTFSGQMFQINAVEGSQFPQGLANIANKHALEFARRASEEAPRLVDTTDKHALSEVESTISISAKRLLSIGSDTMSHPAISQMVAGFRGMAAKALDREILDRLVYATARMAPGTSATIAWNLLVLISNPLNGDVLTTNSEHRRIQSAIREASFRDQINIHIESATRIQDLFRAINEYGPRVVHFCGHGDDKSLVLLDDQNQAKMFDATYLNTFLAADSGSVELVVFNSCHSLAQAMCMLPTVSHVVGTSDALDDASAVLFSESFYSALAYGKSLSTAFEQAKARVAGELGEDYAKVFELRSRPGANAGDSYTVRTSVHKKEASESSQLTELQKSILQAVGINGDIHILSRDQCGQWVMAGDTDFRDDSDRSIAASGLDALHTLVSRGMVRHCGGIHYQLTSSGWGAKRVSETA